MIDVVDDINLPSEIYTPCTEPGYRPAFAGHEARDLNLVVEGGALRGIFAAGALDFLMDMGVWAKNLVGVSAGTLCETKGMAEEARRIGQSCAGSTTWG